MPSNVFNSFETICQLPFETNWDHCKCNRETSRIKSNIKPHNFPVDGLPLLNYLYQLNERRKTDFFWQSYTHKELLFPLPPLPVDDTLPVLFLRVRASVPENRRPRVIG